jgi:hypothetical protein
MISLSLTRGNIYHVVETVKLSDILSLSLSLSLFLSLPDEFLVTQAIVPVGQSEGAPALLIQRRAFATWTSVEHTSISFDSRNESIVRYPLGRVRNKRRISQRSVHTRDYSRVITGTTLRKYTMGLYESTYMFVRRDLPEDDDTLAESAAPDHHFRTTRALDHPCSFFATLRGAFLVAHLPENRKSSGGFPGDIRG